MVLSLILKSKLIGGSFSTAYFILLDLLIGVCYNIYNKGDDDMTEIERMILYNQEIIMLGISKLLTPHCRGSLNDKNGETRTNILLIDAASNVEKVLSER